VNRFERSGRALLAALVLAWSTPAAAQATGRDGEAWQYELTPYVWGAAMKGDVQSGALPRISVDMSFSDIWNNLDAGAMGSFEARKGRWGVFFDAIYMKISSAATAQRISPGPIGATLTAAANVKMQQTLLSAAAVYRAVEGASPVDVFGGLRYVKVDVDADINGSLFALSGSVARSASKDWVDPYVGVRVQHPFANKWTLVAYGDIGGFGVGSDFAWQVAVGANYDFSKTVSGKFGYRIIDVDYDKSGFLYDMKSEGLYAGVGIRF
jgi:opacity protein-like surface antigen